MTDSLSVQAIQGCFCLQPKTLTDDIRVNLNEYLAPSSHKRGERLSERS